MSAKQINRPAVIQSMMDDKSIALDAIYAFESSIHDLINTNKNNLLANNPLEFKKSVHALKGSLSAFGESESFNRLKQIDQLCKTGNFKEAYDLFDNSQSLLELFIIDIADFKAELQRAA